MESLGGSDPNPPPGGPGSRVTESILEGDFTVTTPLFRDMVTISERPRKKVKVAVSGAWQKYMTRPSLSTSSLPDDVFASKISPETGLWSSIVSFSVSGFSAASPDESSIWKTGLVPRAEKRYVFD